MKIPTYLPYFFGGRNLKQTFIFVGLIRISIFDFCYNCSFFHFSDQFDYEKNMYYMHIYVSLYEINFQDIKVCFINCQHYYFNF